jgi:gamma-tubulin complex component 3
MAVLVDSVGVGGSLRGGKLASGLHTHLKHGDPLVKALVSKTLRRVCAPLTDMVH